MNSPLTKIRLKLILNTLSVIGLVVLIILTLQWGHHQSDITAQIKHQNEQIKSLTAQNNQLSKQIADSNQDIKSHIDCIITFFGLSNRLQLSIADICHFSPNEATPKSSPAQSDSKPSNPQGTATQNPPPSSQNNVSQNGQGTNDTPPDPHPPVEVLGVPLCAPLLNACIRQ